MLNKEIVGPPEMAAANERHRRTQCGQRRRMVGKQPQMPACGLAIFPSLRLTLRVGAPKHESERLLTFHQLIEDGIRQALPADACMARGLTLLNGQAGVQKQHSLACPVLKETFRPRGAPVFPRKLLVDVSQTRGKLDARKNIERQPVGLSRPMVGILTEDHHAHGFRRGERQCAQGVRRVDSGASGNALPQELIQLQAGRAAQKAIQHRTPSRSHLLYIGRPSTQRCAIALPSFRKKRE